MAGAIWGIPVNGALQDAEPKRLTLDYTKDGGYPSYTRGKSRYTQGDQEMRNSCKLFAIVLTVLFAPTVSVSEAHEHGTGNGNKVVKVIYDDYCPYYCDNQTFSQRGYLADILNAIYEKRGYQVEFLFAPYARALREVKIGNADVVPGVFENEAKHLLLSKLRIGLLQFVFFVAKENNWEFTSIESLKKINIIGIIRSYDYLIIDGYLRDNPDRTLVISGDNQATRGLKMLLLGRISAFPEDRLVGNFYAAQLNLSDQFREAGNLGDPADLLVAFTPQSKKAKHLKSIYEKGLLDLRKSGELGKILEEYTLTDWE